METRGLLCVVVVSLLALTTAVSGASVRRSALVGGYKPIKDPKGPHVIEIAKFAVSENNKLHGTKLEYVDVIKGEMQVVKGINYRLVISAQDRGATDKNDYMAVVYEGLSRGDRSLVSFQRMVQHS